MVKTLELPLEGYAWLRYFKQWYFEQWYFEHGYFKQWSCKQWSCKQWYFALGLTDAETEDEMREVQILDLTTEKPLIQVPWPSC